MTAPIEHDSWYTCLQQQEDAAKVAAATAGTQQRHGRPLLVTRAAECQAAAHCAADITWTLAMLQSTSSVPAPPAAAALTETYRNACKVTPG